MMDFSKHDSPSTETVLSIAATARLKTCCILLNLSEQEYHQTTPDHLQPSFIVKQTLC